MTFEPISILVLDAKEEDGSYITQLLKEIYSDAEPVQFSWVRSADEALAQFKQTPFTIILLSLPLTQTVGDGLNVLRQVRQIRPDVPVIVLVEQNMIGLGLQALEFGASAYIPRYRLTPRTLRRLKVAIHDGVGHRIEEDDILNRVVFNSLPAHVVVMDEVGRITAVNNEWTQLAAITDNPLIARAKVGTDLPALCRQENAQVIAAGIKDVLAGRRTKFTLEYPWPENGWFVWHLICVTPLRWPQGGAILTSQEVTETIARQIQLSTYEMEIADLKSQFITTVHDLRTPLTSIRLYLDLIGRVGPDKQQHYLLIVKQATIHLEQYVNDLLALARLKENGNDQEVMQVDFSSLVEHVIAIQEPIALDKGLELTLTIDDGPFLVNGRARQLTRIITNLVANAIRYTEAGWVRVQLERDVAANRIGLTVADSGMGIAPEAQPHIFEPFFRSARAQQMSEPGTGLGLAIVQRIVANHDGSVNVTSEPGKGSVFRVWLPAADVV